jgi:NADPH:quinone reductase-like Zn-dependent oxidoreductase
MAATMKAVCAHTRGGPDVLMYEDAPRPQLRSGDALDHVCAAAITPAELSWSPTWETKEGSQRLPIIPSHDVSGVVEEVASGVEEVALGDSVYALLDFWGNGAAAEYVAARAADLAPRPRSLDDIGAAAVPLAALTAWQALFEHGRLAAGQRVLVHGAAGGIGSYAVQIARWKGAEVIGTASAGDLAFVRQLGAVEVIDHQASAFEEVVPGVDLVLDTVGGDTLRRSWAVVRRGGTLVSIVESPSPAAYDRGLHAHHRGKIVLAVEGKGHSAAGADRGP